MNLQFFLGKLKASDEFKKFQNQYPDAFLCSAFFIFDLEKFENKYNLDFYSLSQDKMFSFKFNDEIGLIPLEMMQGSPKPTKLLATSELQFEEIERLILMEMEKQEIKNKMQKIIISLQNLEGKDLFHCTAFISGLGLLKVIIDDASKSITHFEKKSFFDFLRKS